MAPMAPSLDTPLEQGVHFLDALTNAGVVARTVSSLAPKLSLHFVNSSLIYCAMSSFFATCHACHLPFF
jgi:hypothetical protein